MENKLKELLTALEPLIEKWDKLNLPPTACGVCLIPTQQLKKVVETAKKIKGEIKNEESNSIC